MGNTEVKDRAPDQNKEPEENLTGAISDDLSDQDVLSEGTFDETGKDSAPGQHKQTGDNASGKAEGKDEASGQNQEPEFQ